MEEFSTKIKSFREILEFTFKDFFKKIYFLLASLFVISLIEIFLLFLINHRLLKNFPVELLKTNHFLLIAIGILTFFFSIWKFLAIVIVKERIGKIEIKNSLVESLSAAFRILLLIILIGGISTSFLILLPRLIAFLIVVLVYFLVLFSSYISLNEKKVGFEALIRSFQILRRNIFQFYWKILTFFIILLLAFFPLAVFSYLFYFQIFTLPPILNLTLGGMLALTIYFLFLSLANSYLAVLFKNAWEIKKYIAFYPPHPLLMITIYVFLTVILITLILGIGIFK